jgi:hypothetical protein
MEPKDIFCLTASMELFRLLLDDRAEDDGRLSRYGAFVYLLEHAGRHPGTVTAFGQVIPLSAGQLVTSYSELAVVWRWSRDNVRSFFLEMVKTGCVSVERRGKATVISVPVCTAGTPALTRLPTREERDRLRFIFGAMSLEELADMFDSALSETERDVSKLEADNPHDIEIGRRLHRLVSHLVLHPSGFFPKDDNVADALRGLFVDDCGSDLARFFTLLTIGGIKLVDDRCDNTEFPLSLPDSTMRRLAVVLEYYSPFIRHGVLTNPDAFGSHGRAAPDDGKDATPHTV